MKSLTKFLVAVLTAVALFGFATALSAQESDIASPREISESAQKAPVHIPSAQGRLIIPKSSLPQATPAGHRFAAHTNVRIFIPAGVKPESLPPFPGMGYETPASLACVYGLTAAVAGCNPNNNALANPTGGSNTIAIVDAFDNPSAPGDLAWFSLQFGIPLTLSQFQVVWATTATSSCFGETGVPVDPTGGWEVEESLDVQWAHAMAPSANIYLVESCSDFDTDLQQAVLVANNLVQCGQTEIDQMTGNLGTCPAGSKGKGEVSMSWGASEYVGENTSDKCATPDDSCFVTPNVVYFASAGDSPGVEWPSTSPNVVSAGGLTNRRDPTTFNEIGQAGWVFGGGGQSAIEKQPSYQSSNAGVQKVCGKVWRCNPDVSFDADPYTGVYVYDTFPVDSSTCLDFFGAETCPTWLILGGTSVSAPALAGIINRAGGFAASSNAELTTIYKNMAVTTDFTDITSAFCGNYMGFTAITGWDFCTGVGAVKGYVGK